jgi:F-type H+-transporting ATPase subunit b
VTMKSHLRKVVGFVIALFFLLLPAMLWAIEEGHGGHGEGHGGHDPHISGLVFPAINFLIFAFVLWKYVIPTVRDTLRQRREKITRALDEAKRAKEEAESLRREYEQRLAGLAAEQEKTRAEALEAAERERNRIVEEARLMGERVKNEAQQIAQREVEEARRVLRQEVANQAVRMATELLKSRLAQADHRRFVQDLVTEVQNAANASR